MESLRDHKHLYNAQATILKTSSAYDETYTLKQVLTFITV